MKFVIYKYPVVASNFFMINLPVGAKILTVQTQNEEPHIWALVDADAPTEERWFAVIATGQTIVEADAPNKPLGNYIGTFQLMGGALVFHLFERIK